MCIDSAGVAGVETSERRELIMDNVREFSAAAKSALHLQAKAGGGQVVAKPLRRRIRQVRT